MPPSDGDAAETGKAETDSARPNNNTVGTRLVIRCIVDVSLNFLGLFERAMPLDVMPITDLAGQLLESIETPS
jgi:hypothetical protein